MKKRKFDVTKEVDKVLFESVESRDDDYVLYGELAKNLGIKNIGSISLGEYVKLVYCKCLPSIEVVGRIRRREQSTHPEFRGSLNARERRKKNEIKYREFFTQEI